MAMNGDVRQNLEKLFAISNGIIDPIAKMQFDLEAFSLVEKETGFGLESLTKIREAEAADKSRRKSIADLDHFLQELRDELRNSGSPANVFERMSEMRKSNIQSEGTFHSTLLERLGRQYERYEDYVWTRTGRLFAGLRQSIFPTLNYALNGFQGVTMVAGPTNSSKTQFFLHNVVSVLRDNPDCAVLYLALDQPESKLLSRLCACISGQRVEQFEQGSHPGEKEPLTEDDIQARHVGFEWLREHLGSQLFLFDRSYFPSLRVSFEDIKAAVKLVKKESGLKRVSIWVDYLDQLVVEDQNKMKDIAVDQERVQALLDWHLLNPDDPVLAITEVNKESTKDGEPIRNSGVMGTSRKVYAPDNVLIINPLSNEEIMGWTDDFVGGDVDTMRLKIVGPRPVEYDDKEIKTKLFRQEAEKRRQWLSNHDMSLGSVTVTKVRDGGRRCKVYYTNFFRCSRFSEGLSIVE